MKIKNKLLIFLTLLTLIIPLRINAYSNKVILGGDNIGITVESNGIIIAGFYQVNNKNINLSNNIKLGDKIIKINNIKINNIEEMVSLIEKNITNNQVDITILRKQK